MVQAPESQSQGKNKVDEELLKSFDVLNINIISSTQIYRAAERTIAHLKRPADVVNETGPEHASKPHVVVLNSKSSSGAKLITVAEIAKRDLSASSSFTTYQYNVLGSKTVQLDPATKPDRLAGAADADAGADEDEDEDAFQTMPVQSKIRVTATMSIVLSTMAIPKLRREYGEQSSTDGRPP